MAESNELNFGNLENSNDVIENNLDDVTQNQDEKENKIKFEFKVDLKLRHL